jgi:hypothetical protein
VAELADAVLIGTKLAGSVLADSACWAAFCFRANVPMADLGSVVILTWRRVRPRDLA